MFTGADGSFDYYEDDGVSYGYERGEFARIPLRYDAAKGTLTIGARSGSYPGMPEKRTFKVRWIKAGAKAPADLDAAADATVEYKGAEVAVPGEWPRNQIMSPFGSTVVKPSSRGGVLY